MKKILILAILFASCKKEEEISPNICYEIKTDVTTVYMMESGDMHYETHGQPIYTRIDTMLCNISVKGVLDYIKSIDVTNHETIGICISKGSSFYKVRK